MLAWVHQAVALEKELFVALFSVETINNGVVESKDDGESSPAHSQHQDLIVLDEVFIGIIKPLTVRIEQVLSSQIGLVLAYKLSNLFVFYSQTVINILGPSSLLSTTLKVLEEKCTSLFQELMNNQTEKLVSSAPQYPSDLSPPHALGEITARLSEILSVFNNSLVPHIEREERFSSLLDSVYDPLKRMCEVSSENLDTCNRCVFLINTYHSMQQTLIPYDFVSGWVTKLAIELDELVDILVEENHKIILTRCGVSQVLANIDSSSGQDLLKIDGLDSASLKVVVRSFTTTAFSLVIPLFERIRKCSINFFHQ
jgi:hypothetical protein